MHNFFSKVTHTGSTWWGQVSSPESTQLAPELSVGGSLTPEGGAGYSGAEQTQSLAFPLRAMPSALSRAQRRGYSLGSQSCFTNSSIIVVLHGPPSIILSMDCGPYLNSWDRAVRASPFPSLYTVRFATHLAP